MDKNEKRILTDAIQAVVMAIGREQNAIEFYGYLAETSQTSKTKQFFKEMEERETDDFNVLESFLEKLKKEDEGDCIK